MMCHPPSSSRKRSLTTIALAAISLTGALGLLVASSFALAIVAMISGLAVRFHPGDERPATSGLEVLLGPFVVSGWQSGVAGCVWLAAVGGVAAILAMRTAAMDWNYLLQKLTVLAIWMLTFALCYVASRSRHRIPARFCRWICANSAAC